jgi:hypothetical protein
MHSGNRVVTDDSRAHLLERLTQLERSYSKRLHHFMQRKAFVQTALVRLRMGGNPDEIQTWLVARWKGRRE